jgi:hypothetical protein
MANYTNKYDQLRSDIKIDGEQVAALDMLRKANIEEKMYPIILAQVGASLKFEDMRTALNQTFAQLHTQPNTTTTTNQTITNTTTESHIPILVTEEEVGEEDDTYLDEQWDETQGIFVLRKIQRKPYNLKDVRCYNCKTFGHYARNCRKKKDF